MHPSHPIRTDLSREANLSQKIEWLGARRNRAALAPVNLRVCQGPAVSIGHRCCPLKPDILRTTLETPIADWPVRQDNPTTGVDGCCARGASVDFDAVADPLPHANSARSNSMTYSSRCPRNAPSSISRCLIRTSRERPRPAGVVSGLVGPRRDI